MRSLLVGPFSLSLLVPCGLALAQVTPAMAGSPVSAPGYVPLALEASDPATHLDAGAEAVDLGRLLPGDFHGGFLANVQSLLRDFPGIAHEGWAAEQIDAWVAKGWPDPRTAVAQLALGLNVNVRKKEVLDVMLLGSGRLQLAAKIRKLAQASNLPIEEEAYHGVVFVRPKWEVAPVTVAEVLEGASLFAYDKVASWEFARKMVDTQGGQHPSFGDKHSMSLTPDTYLAAAVRVPVFEEARASEEFQTAGFHLVVQAAIDWKKTGSQVQLGVDFETWTPVEAKLLADWLAGRIDSWEASTQNAYLKRFLEALRVRRDGKHVFVELATGFELMAEGLAAANRELATPTLD